MELNDILGMAVKANASDVHLKVGLPPVYRIDGALRPLPKAPRLSPEDIRKMAYAMMSEMQRKKFETSNEVDLAYGVQGMGRFRVNMFTQRGSISMILRTIPFNVQTLEELDLPPVIKKLTQETRGLILVTGTTGSGKSTTLASMIDCINANRTAHVITIEDPIEFLHRDKKSIINQREVGVDTETFANALKSALRQDPDVILVGEMRDFETIETALTAAETGHLVLSTLHTVDAQESINRIVGAFPPFQQRQIRLQLASILKGVISQRLVPRADGKGRVPAVEVMVSTARVRELIDDKEKTKMLRDTIQQGYDSYGMQTFDQSLMGLLKKELITFEEALRQSTNPDDFKLKVSGISSSSDLTWEQFNKDNDAGDTDDNNGLEKVMGSDQPDPYALALRWLTRRSYSEADLRRRLQRKGCDDAAIEQALQRCRELGYIDDRRFALHRAQQLWRQGRAVGPRLLQQLKQEGLSEALALEAIDQCLTEQDEHQLLTELVERRYGRLDFSGLDQRQRRRMVNYLQRRGFPLAMILNHLHARERQID